MADHVGPTFRNDILAALPANEITRLRPHLTRGRMVNGQSLHEPGERIEQVYFFEDGFVSMVSPIDTAQYGVEVGLIGREGIVGAAAAFSASIIAFNRAQVQLAGTAFRMSAVSLRAALDDTPVLKQALFRSMEGLMAQVSQTAACNSRHTLSERCSRWLLLAHDRIDGDDLLLTQEFLSIMLAVRRSGVTVAIGTLQSAGLIRTGRGRIVIADRAALEGAACACYGRVQRFVKTMA